MSGITFGARFVQGQADDDTHNIVLLDLFEKLRHGKALPGAAGEGSERPRENLHFVRKGEPDPALAPVYCQQPSDCPSLRHPCDIV